jgi:hypothetical protein
VTESGLVLRRVAWTKESVVGMEFAAVELWRDRLSARVVAIADDPVPYRLDYSLETGPDFVTRLLRLTTAGEGWTRSLALTRDEAGDWQADAESDGEGSQSLAEPGGDLAAIAGALDCDVAHSPVTNSMPVLRDRLLAGAGAHDYLMAWVSLPNLSFQPSRQRYVSTPDVSTTGIVRYESLDGDFTADLTFDTDGLVIDYPQLGRRLGQARRLTRR